MKVWSNFALIAEKEDDPSVLEVKNVVSFKYDQYVEAEHLARAAFGGQALAVDVTYIECEPGDTYRDGHFYRIEDGEEVQCLEVLSDEQQLGNHEDRLYMSESAIDDLAIAILEG